MWASLYNRFADDGELYILLIPVHYVHLLQQQTVLCVCRRLSTLLCCSPACASTTWTQLLIDYNVSTHWISLPGSRSFLLYLTTDICDGPLVSEVVLGRDWIAAICGAGHSLTDVTDGAFPICCDPG